MIRIDIDEVKSELDLKRFGTLGWLTNKDQPCAFCGRKGKWGVFLKPEGGGVFHCWYCDSKKSLFEYLKAIDRLDLINSNYEASVKSKLTALVSEQDSEDVNEQVKKVSLPKKLEPLVHDPYLDSRGFLDYHYKEFEPSITNFFLEKNLENYIIFKLKMNGEVVAWLARSRYSKEWHAEDLKKAKETGRKPKLRYENSRTDFTKIIGGYDHITDKTETVILVEGIFDSVGIDRLLETPEDESVRCCFTFGNSISKEQINLLTQKKSLRNIILMYDEDALLPSKSAGLTLSKHFNTYIAHLTRSGIDPNDMDIDYLIEILDNLEDPINFYVNKLPKRW